MVQMLERCVRYVDSISVCCVVLFRCEVIVTHASEPERVKKFRSSFVTHILTHKTKKKENLRQHFEWQKYWIQFSFQSNENHFSHTNSMDTIQWNAWKIKQRTKRESEKKINTQKFRTKKPKMKNQANELKQHVCGVCRVMRIEWNFFSLWYNSNWKESRKLNLMQFSAYKSSEIIKPL